MILLDENIGINIHDFVSGNIFRYNIKNKENVNWIREKNFFYRKKSEKKDWENFYR